MSERIIFQMRMTPEERALLERAAAELGLPLGTWLRMVGLEEAKKRLASRPPEVQKP